MIRNKALSRRTTRSALTNAFAIIDEAPSRSRSQLRRSLPLIGSPRLPLLLQSVRPLDEPLATTPQFYPRRNDKAAPQATAAGSALTPVEARDVARRLA